jgi:hypothetical protein
MHLNCQVALLALLRAQPEGGQSLYLCAKEAHNHKKTVYYQMAPLNSPWKTRVSSFRAGTRLGQLPTPFAIKWVHIRGHAKQNMTDHQMSF